MEAETDAAQNVVVDGPLPKIEETREAPPRQTSGNLGNVHRLVARHQLKDRIKILENIIKTHQPLIQAMKVTQKAYQQGVMEGIRQVAEAEKQQQAAKVTPNETV